MQIVFSPTYDMEIEIQKYEFINGRNNDVVKMKKMLYS